MTRASRTGRAPCSWTTLGAALVGLLLLACAQRPVPSPPGTPAAVASDSVCPAYQALLQARDKIPALRRAVRSGHRQETTTAAEAILSKTKPLTEMPDISRPSTRFADLIGGAADELSVGALQLEEAWIQGDPAATTREGLSALSEAEADIRMVVAERSKLGSGFECP